MRLNIILFVTFLFSIATALVIPADAAESIALERRDNRKWVVPAGGDKPEQVTYTWSDIEGARNDIGRGGTTVIFQNRPNESPNTKPIPSMVGTGIEVTLPNKAGTGKGPARAIFQEEMKGKKKVYKFVAVVAHDQSRGQGAVGRHDHFQINPS